MLTLDPATLDWNKGDGLLPAVAQHWRTGAVLMLGYMNAAALVQTQESRKVTFWSRSRNRLWTKGETSGHVLEFKSLCADCDRDAILVQAQPLGPTCHLGTPSCFGAGSEPALAFLSALDALIAARERDRPDSSYTTELFAAGIQRIAQKVGEEAVETALAAVAQDQPALLGEAADLVYHLLVLLRARGLGLTDLAALLAQRHHDQSPGRVPDRR